MDRYLNGKTYDEVAIERLREHEAAALEMSKDGYWVAYSGGKDSVVVLDLVRRAGVKHVAVHNITTCDPPELVAFVAKQRPAVRISRPPITMFELIRKKGMPPRRNARYCCEVLKERGGEGHVVVTGVRWAESSRRSRRQMIEPCYRSRTKRYFHPIIDWPTDAVWRYMRERGLEYCSLYDEGFSRVGCVLCPMVRDVKRQIERWPSLAKAWERAIKDTWRPGPDKRYSWPSAEDYWQWWLDRDAAPLSQPDMALFGDGLSQQGCAEDET